MSYKVVKGLAGPKVRKTDRELFLMPEEVGHMLTVIRNSGRARSERDHAIIFLALMFGLRCGEVRLLRRDSFEAIDRGVAELATLKCATRVKCRCAHCRKPFRVAGSRSGKTYPCPRCGTETDVPRVKMSNPTPRRAPPIVESKTREYVKMFMSSIPARQEYLFENARGQPLSSVQVRRIFNYWVMQSGINPVTSFHALRHGRGVMIWNASKDIELVRRQLRQTSLGSTQRYVHLSDAAKREYEDRLEEIDILENANGEA